MSLLDSGPDSITLTPAVWGSDDDGNQRWLPGTTSVTVWGTVEFSSSTAQSVEGQQVRSQITFITRELPKIPATKSYRYAKATWNGRNWHCNADPTFYRRGVATRHVSITLEAES
jgi:hypothetical protein